MNMTLNEAILVKKIDNSKKYLEEGNNKKALKVLNELVKEKPSFSEAWLCLGIAKRRLNNLNGAIECFKVVCELDNSMLEAWGLLTISLVDQGKIEIAKETIEKAGQLNPYNSKIQFFRNNLIKLYTKFGPFF